MKKNRRDLESETAAADLRRLAEEKLATRPEPLEVLSPEAVRQVFHELQVHQIELEMQNEELRQAQAALEVSRARYFNLYDLAPVGYCTISEQGLILEANLTAATLLGVARSALVKQPLSQFIVREDQDLYFLHHKQLFGTDAPHVCELRMLRREGSPFMARVAAATAQDADGRPVRRVVMSDVTAHHIIEEAFRRKEKDSFPAVSRDPQSLSVRSQGEPVNILLLEDDPAHAEAVQRAFLDSGMKTVAHGVRTLREFQALAAAQTPDIAIVDLHLPDGNAVDVLTSPPEAGAFPILIMTGYGDERVAVEAMKAGAIDYLEKSSGAFAATPRAVERSLREWGLLQTRKRMAEALRREKENFQHSLDDSPLGVRIVTADGITLYANRAILEMYRYDSVEELRNTSLEERYTPESLVEFQARRKLRGKGGLGPTEYEIGILRKNGEVRRLRVFRKEILWDGEKRFQALYSDITEDRKRENKIPEFEKTIRGQQILLTQQSSSVEELIDRLTRSREELGASYEALKANKDALVRSEKLAFTGRMASSIAHEIRNPLTNIILSIRQLTKDDRLKPENHSYVKIVERNTERIDFLITELLNCARPIKLDLQPCDVHRLIKDVLVSHKVGLKTRKIEVIKNLSSPPAILLVDKEYLGRVFLNLIGNALEAMRPGGKMWITTKNEKGLFLITVRDNGKGISEKNLLRIFDPFFSTKKRGMGLGLSTCQNIVTSHKGTIEVESAWRKGSSFTVRLPREPMPSGDEGGLEGQP